MKRVTKKEKQNQEPSFSGAAADGCLFLLTAIRGFLKDRRCGPFKFMRRRLLFRWLLNFPVSCVFVSHAKELATV
jgi:hypothetical protein